MNSIKVLSGSTNAEVDNRNSLVKLLKETPIPDQELLSNLGLFLNRQTLSRIFFMNDLYKRIVNVHGVVMEFGVRWGQNMSLFSSFRGMYEPYNYNRKVIGFDTFEGFPEVDLKDGNKVAVGDYAVTQGYSEYLSQILEYQQSESPISHKKKFELIKGDASQTVDGYLAAHPETIVALAYFDFDIYPPTRKCLEAIKPRLTKGSVLAFDELNFESFPGETIAFDEVLGINNYAIQRDPLNPLCSYIVFSLWL
jgi:hypothetical protein